MTIPGLSAQDMDDVDSALEGPAVGLATVSEARFLLNEETCLSYYFDVLDLGAITNPDLLDHIERVGLVVYERTASPKGPVPLG